MLCLKGHVCVRLQCKRPLLWLTDMFAYMWISFEYFYYYSYYTFLLALKINEPWEVFKVFRSIPFT